MFKQKVSTISELFYLKMVVFNFSLRAFNKMLKLPWI